MLQLGLVDAQNSFKAHETTKQLLSRTGRRRHHSYRKQPIEERTPGLASSLNATDEPLSVAEI